MPICAGPIVQIAWVTEDLDVTEHHLGQHYGAGRWTRFENVVFAPDTCEFRGRPAAFEVSVSLTYIAEMQLELIQPLRGENIYTEFLAAGGRGLHHICFETADMRETLARAGNEGVSVVQRGSMAGLMEFAYLDGAAAGVPYVEIAYISDGMRRIFDQIKAES
jgi:catechol 2,3-dioxygenase-like lactoylglutathione lyase family enzyme